MPAAPTSISAHCGALPDPRVARTRDHLLLAILTIGRCAVLCGGAGWTDMATFGRAREPWLRTFLALPHGIPSRDTFERVFAALDPDACGAAFIAWARAVAPWTVGQVAASDGETLRRTHERARGRAAVHLVRAWADASGPVLGQVAVDNKANVIVAIPQLLALLDVRGCTVTIDALGCQAAIARQIVAQGGDDVLALQDNRLALHHSAAPGSSPTPRSSPTAMRRGAGRGSAASGWSRRGAAATGAAARSAIICSARRATRPRSGGSSDAIGGSSIGGIGPSLSPATRTRAGSARAMPPGISPPYASARATCRAGIVPAGGASPPNASSPRSTSATCPHPSPRPTPRPQRTPNKMRSP